MLGVEEGEMDVVGDTEGLRETLGVTVLEGESEGVCEGLGDGLFVGEGETGEDVPLGVELGVFEMEGEGVLVTCEGEGVLDGLFDFEGETEGLLVT
ncbi:hypothetical protein MarSH_262 [Marseillevirus Shanghai 1]|nr:hypothetical protein MarSH_262 [Marseillevirus Shanghai 1]